jgi:hypothetical protein
VAAGNAVGIFVTVKFTAILSEKFAGDSIFYEFCRRLPVTDLQSVCHAAFGIVFTVSAMARR